MSTFNISEKMNHSLFHSYVSWLDVKLQHAKAAPDFPSVTKGYVRWIVDQKYGGMTSTAAFPWIIKMVGANLERELSSLVMKSRGLSSQLEFAF